MGANDRELEARESRAEARRAKAPKQAEWRGYINADISEGVKAQWDDWMCTEGPWEHLQAIVETGCVVSLKLDGHSSRFLGSITQRNPDSVNAGLCVTARGSTPEKALFRAVFTVAWLGVNASWSESAPVADDDRW